MSAGDGRSARKLWVRSSGLASGARPPVSAPDRGEQGTALHPVAGSELLRRAAHTCACPAFPTHVPSRHAAREKATDPTAIPAGNLEPPRGEKNPARQTGAGPQPPPCHHVPALVEAVPCAGAEPAPHVVQAPSVRPPAAPPRLRRSPTVIAPRTSPPHAPDVWRVRPHTRSRARPRVRSKDETGRLVAHSREIVRRVSVSLSPPASSIPHRSNSTITVTAEGFRSSSGAIWRAGEV